MTARLLATVALLALLGSVALFAGLGPLGPLPGGILTGPERAPPDDWSFTDAIAEIQVQTHVGPLPWTVTTWVMSHEGRLFIGASECDRVWTHRVFEDPVVRVRIGGVVYLMNAHRETDRTLGAALAPVMLHKYMGIAVDSANWIPGASEGCILRVEPRT